MNTRPLPQLTILLLSHAIGSMIHLAVRRDAPFALKDQMKRQTSPAMNLRLNKKAVALGLENEDMTAIIKTLEARPADE